MNTSFIIHTQNVYEANYVGSVFPNFLLVKDLITLGPGDFEY